MSERKGAYKTIEYAFVLILLGSIIILSKGFISYAVSPVFIGLGLGLLIPSMLVGVSEETDSSEYGAAFSFSTTYWDTGGLIGPLLGGVLSTLSGYRLAVLMYPLLNAFALGVFTLYYIDKRRTGEARRS
jgi:MFS family permease